MKTFARRLVPQAFDFVTVDAASSARSRTAVAGTDGDICVAVAGLSGSGESGATASRP